MKRMEQDREPEQRRPSPPPAEPSSLSQTLIRMTIAVLIGTCISLMLFTNRMIIIGSIGGGLAAGLIAGDKKSGFVAGLLSAFAAANILFFLKPLAQRLSMEKWQWWFRYGPEGLAGVCVGAVFGMMLLGLFGALSGMAGGMVGGSARKRWRK